MNWDTNVEIESLSELREDGEFDAEAGRNENNQSRVCTQDKYVYADRARGLAGLGGVTCERAGQGRGDKKQELTIGEEECSPCRSSRIPVASGHHEHGR